MSTITLTPDGKATIKDVLVTLKHPDCADSATVESTSDGKWHTIGPRRDRTRPAYDPWGDFDGWVYNHGELVTESFDEAINFACAALQARADALTKETAK